MRKTIQRNKIQHHLERLDLLVITAEHEFTMYRILLVITIQHSSTDSLKPLKRKPYVYVCGTTALNSEYYPHYPLDIFVIRSVKTIQ